MGARDARGGRWTCHVFMSDAHNTDSYSMTSWWRDQQQLASTRWTVLDWMHPNSNQDQKNYLRIWDILKYSKQTSVVVFYFLNAEVGWTQHTLSCWQDDPDQHTQYSFIMHSALVHNDPNLAQLRTQWLSPILSCWVYIKWKCLAPENPQLAISKFGEL